LRAAVEGETCVRARRTLSLALDGEAGAADVLKAASHLSRCQRCREFAVQVIAFTSELRSTGGGRS
jgi:predicted anti-sigma-YlaC factor YlaD